MYLTKRKGIYYIFYKQGNGNMSCISTRTKIKSEATKFLSNFQRELQKRKDEKLTPVKLKDFKNKFLKYSGSTHSPKHTSTMKSCLNMFIEYFGDVYLSQIKRNDIQRYIEFRLNKVSGYAVKRDITVLSSAFKWGIMNGYLVNNIAEGLRKPRIPEKMPVYFTDEQFDTLLDFTESGDLRDLFSFAVMTGLRQGDLINLIWQQINLKQKTLILDNRNSLTKNRKVHTLPLNNAAITILKKRKVKAGNEYVFTYNGNYIKQHFISHKIKKIIKKAGLDNRLNFHSLRHTFASRLIQKGVPILNVSKLMTHSDLRVTQIYSHLRYDDLRSSVEFLD